MKKLLFVLFVMLSLIVSGCGLMAKIPSDVVSKFLNKYKNNDTVVVNELNEFLDDEELSDEEKKEYKEIYLRQYSNLKYEIKDEKIDGDEATVDVQITVFDYYKSNTEAGNYFTSNQSEFIDSNGNIDLTKYASYKIDKMLETKDTIDYTLTLKLTKTDGDWEVSPLTSEQLQKIHGTYEY